MPETQNNTETIQKDEIDLIEIFRKIKKGRKTIYKTVAVFIVIGLILALGTPKEYKSEVTLLVESGGGSSGMSGLLQQVGGLAGISLGSGGGKDALSPELYPDVVKSTPFLLEILNQKVTESKFDSTLTVAQYLERHTKSSIGSVTIGYTLGLPGKIIGWIKGKPKNQGLSPKNRGLFKLTREQTDMIDGIARCITTKQKESSGTLMISVEMQDPQVATLLVDSVVKSLTKYVIEYRTQKAKTDLQYAEQRHADAEVKYISAQHALAAHKDQNKNIVFATARAEEERLQSEYNLAFNIFNAVSQQLEQAKMKLQENTPVFKIMEPAKVPLNKSKPRTSLILVAMVFLGALVGSGIIMFKSSVFIKI
jgi:capsular polysaccharide biosynthesis protein